MEFLENKEGKIIAGDYFISTAEILNGAPQIVTSALLILKNYILGLIQGSDSRYLFDSHGNDKNGNLSSSG